MKFKIDYTGSRKNLIKQLKKHIEELESEQFVQEVNRYRYEEL